MRGLGGVDVFGAFITERPRIQTRKKVFPGAQQDGADREMRFVNEACLEVLPNGRDPAADPDVFAISRITGALQRSMDAVRDKMKSRASFHHEWFARVTGQHEYMIWRV